jgi:hypothetical protein
LEVELSNPRSRPFPVWLALDFDDSQIAAQPLEAGAWPQGRQFAVERGSAIGIGDQVQLEIATRTTQARISGVFYTLSQPSAALGSDPIFYTSRAQFAALTGQDGFGQVIAAVPSYTAERAAAATDAVQARLRAYGFEVQPGSLDNTKVANPNRAFFQDPVEGVGTILQSIGIIAVVCAVRLEKK